MKFPIVRVHMREFHPCQDGIETAHIRRNFDALENVPLCVFNHVLVPGAFPTGRKVGIVKPFYIGGPTSKLLVVSSWICPKRLTLYGARCLTVGSFIH